MMSFPGICNLNRISIYPVHFLLIVLVCDNACIWKVPCVIVVSPSLTSSLSFFLSLSLSLPLSLFSLWFLSLTPSLSPSHPPSTHTLFSRRTFSCGYKVKHQWRSLTLGLAAMKEKRERGRERERERKKEREDVREGETKQDDHTKILSDTAIQNSHHFEAPNQLHDWTDGQCKLFTHEHLIDVTHTRIFHSK